MKYLFFLLALLISLQACRVDTKNNTKEHDLNQTDPPSINRAVNQNVLISDTLPNIKIKVSEEFEFIGNFDFEIVASSDEYADSIRGQAVAAGERYVFAKHANNTVEKLFIVQLEGFLPEFGFTYNYNFEKANFIGNNNYRHNIWFYNSKEMALQNPEGEGAKTRTFLEEKGFKLEDEYMMSRFVGLASDDRQNEIIIYYIEMLKNFSSNSLEKFQNATTKEEKEQIEKSLIERSKESFSIIEG